MQSQSQTQTPTQVQTLAPLFPSPSSLLRSLIPRVIDPALLERAQSVCDVDRHECSRPLTWEELGVLLAADVPQYLSRLVPNQRAYMEARKRMSAEYRSVSDHVREHKFGATCSLNAQGKKECNFAPADLAAAAAVAAGNAADLAAMTAALPPSRIFPNDFHYALEAGITHDLVWLQRPLERNDTRILRLVEHYKPSATFDTMHLVNPPNLQTIPDIFHIHIFARNRTAAADVAAVVVTPEASDAVEQRRVVRRRRQRRHLQRP